MKLFPAIDLYGGKAVRLLRGDYAQMTVYSDRPLSVARDFAAAGAECLHLVDLEGARDGRTPNLETVIEIVKNTDLFTEIGGGIRNLDTVETYLSAGVNRVILGTAAVEDDAFLQTAVEQYGDRIAVGVDVKEGYVAVKGWTENSGVTLFDFLDKMERVGVKTLICTDISKDGAMQGTNRCLYRQIGERYPAMQIIASGGVSSLDDICALKDMGLYGAIVGKAYYIGAIDLRQALEAVK